MSIYEQCPKAQQITRLPEARPGDRVRLRGRRQERVVAQVYAAITESERVPLWRARMETGEVWEARALVVVRKGGV